MRPPSSRILQTFSLLIGAMALVLSSAGLVGASQGEGERGAASASASAEKPEHAAEKQDKATGSDRDVAVDEDSDTNAHPSGKDRSVEPGKSGDQGNAQSDPDDDGNGPERSNDGADKPEGPGGVDKTDQDANNGCGNDTDFEDDNEGLCLGRTGAPGQQSDDGEGTDPDDVDNDNDNDNDNDENVGGDSDNDNEMVTLCHATGSESNPYVVITVSENAVMTEGHDGHEDDVIPAFGDYEGKNLDGDLDVAGCESDDDNGTDDTDVDDDDTDVDGDDDENGDDGDEENVVDDNDGDNGTNVDEDEDEVLGEVVVNIPETTPVNPATPAAPTVNPATPASPAVQTLVDRDAQVLGSQVTRTGQLARTGDDTPNLVPFGLGLVLLGFGLQRTSKRFNAARIR